MTLLAILWLLPMSIVIAMGALSFQYDPRYVLFCAVPYYVLIARGVSEVKAVTTRRVLVACMLAYGVFALRANYFIPHKENYRDALGHLAQEYREGDCCVFLPFEAVPPQWSIYYGNDRELAVATIDAISSGRAQCNRVWLTTYRRVPWAVERSDEGERVLAVTHAKAEERRYFWVNVALYVPRREVRGRDTAAGGGSTPAGSTVGPEHAMAARATR